MKKFEPNACMQLLSDIPKNTFISKDMRMVFTRGIVTSHKFKFGEVTEKEPKGLELARTGLRLPYDKTVFEYHFIMENAKDFNNNVELGAVRQNCVLLCVNGKDYIQEPGDVVIIHVFLQADWPGFRTWQYSGIALSCFMDERLDNGFVKVGTSLRDEVKKNGYPKDNYEAVSGHSAQEFFYLLATLTDHQSQMELMTAPTKLQKKRKKRGQRPFFDYWVLDLNTVSKLKKPHQGGTHASPRVHTRRGHWRNTKLGKRVWVKQSVVGGGGAPGIVMKDYSIRREQ